MSRLSRLKTKTHGEDGQWAYEEITTLRQRVAELERFHELDTKQIAYLFEERNLLTTERDDLLEAHRIGCEDLVERHNRIAELTTVLERLNTQEPALVRYNKHMNGEIEPDPVERLRFFLSLALTGQNWLDVEKFLDDLPTDDVVRDAERYRWLRDSGKGDDLIRGDCRGIYLPESSALDQAIDSAMEKS